MCSFCILLYLLRRVINDMIQFTNIQKTYTINDSKKHVLDNVSFSIHQGQIFGIVGESGAGKSTLLKLLLQLVQPDAGSFLTQGKNASYAFRHTTANADSVWLHKMQSKIFNSPKYAKVPILR